ncbi:MAG: hypothetical protein EOM26_13245, partial [Alphaproteobacteria bacterium]|nr:hypothetical protein [Alphaproteobacteria bacterium]
YCSGYGIDANTMAAGTISGNTIRYCDNNGIDLYRSSPTVIANVLYGNGKGIAISHADSTPGLSYNDFVGNPVGLDNTSGNLIAAENNWWGSTTGPSGVGPGAGDSVSANVDYTPWLGMPNSRYYSGEASIVGHVYRDINSNGQYDSGEGVSGATVRTLNGFIAENMSTADGSYEITDIPGDAGYIVMAEALGYSAGVREGVWVNALNATAVDIPLRQIDISTLSVEQISPNPNDYDHNGTEDAMTLMKGGTGYRYYRVVNSLGEGVSACGFTVKRADGVVITNGVTVNYQGLPGVMQIAIPESALSVSGPSGDVSCIVTHLNGVELPSYKNKSFLVQVRPREHNKTWKYAVDFDSTGTLAGGATLEAVTGFSIKLMDRDGVSSDPDLVEFKRNIGGGVGLAGEAPTGIKAGVKLAGAEIKGRTGVDLSAKLLVGASMYDQHELSYFLTDPNQLNARVYLMCFPGLAQSKYSNPMMFACLEAVEQVANIAPFRTEGYGGLYLRGEGEAAADLLSLSGDTPLGRAKFGIGAGLEAGFRVDGGLAVRPQENEVAAIVRANASLTADWSVGLKQYHGQSRRWFESIGIGDKYDLVDAKRTFELVWDSNGLSLQRIELGYKATFLDFTQFGDQDIERTWVITGSAQSLNRLLYQSAIVAALGGFRTAVPSGALVVDQATFTSLLDELELYVSNPANGLSVSYEDRNFNVGWKVHPTFGANGSVFGAAGDINVGIEFEEKKDFATEQGCLIGSRLYPLGQYVEDQYCDSSAWTLGDYYADAWSFVDWDGLFTFAIATAQSGVQTVVDTVVSVGQGVLTLGADSVATGTEVLNNAWAGFWSALPPPQAMSASTYGTYGLMEATAEEEGATNNWRFGIGGFYDLQPAGTVLSSPGTLVISYADSEVEGISEDTLAMYLWNTNSLRWDYQGGTVDLAGNSVSNQISVLGLYTLAPRMPYDFAELTPVPGAIPNDGASTVVFTSGVISNDDNTVISDGQLFTVSASGGTITTPDADGSVTGLQVTATSGQISFTVQSSLAATSLTVNASSVIGEAFADGQVPFVNAGAPAAPQNVAAVVDGTAIRVSWQSITNSDVVGYSVLYDDDNGAEPFEGKAGVIGDDSPIDVGNVSVYRLYGLETNATYYVGIKATDAFGLESPLSAVVSVLNTCPPDSDADGLPDSWENQFATPTVPSVVGVSVAHFDSLQDNDADGMNNFSEYIAGTDPTDASSLFGVAEAMVVKDPMGFAVEWDGVNGRAYQVYVTTNLVGSWTAYGGPLAGSNGTMRVTVPMTNAVPQFIKLNVQKD